MKALSQQLRSALFGLIALVFFATSCVPERQGMTQSLDSESYWGGSDPVKVAVSQPNAVPVEGVIKILGKAEKVYLGARGEWTKPTGQNAIGTFYPTESFYANLKKATVVFSLAGGEPVTYDDVWVSPKANEEGLVTCVILYNADTGRSIIVSADEVPAALGNAATPKLGQAAAKSTSYHRNDEQP